ncbi:transposase [uncultured Roseobacter sp.]
MTWPLLVGASGSAATYYNWRKRFGGMGRAQLSEMKSLEKENDKPLERH